MQLEIQRDLSNPFDRGYWARYDGKPRPSDPNEAKGWDVCADELHKESTDLWFAVMGVHPDEPLGHA